MKRSFLVVFALLLAAPFAGARGGGGRGFSRGHGFARARASSGFHAFSLVRGSSGGFSRASSRPSFGRSMPFRTATRSSAGHSSGRATFHAAASKTARGLSRVASGSTAPPAWAAPGAKIVSAGQPPVYSQAAGGGTHSVEGGGFIAMDQSRAQDVGRAPGVTWGAPSRAAGSSTGGGSGGSSNGPAFDPSF